MASMRRACLLLPLLALACVPGDDDEGGADESAPIEACIAEGELARPLLITDESAAELRVLEPGAEVLSLSAPAADAQGALQLVAAGGTGEIAVASNYSYTGADGLVEGSSLRLFARDSGELAWEQAVPDHRFFALWIDAEGRLVAQAGTGSGQSMYGLVRAEGEVFELANYRPMAGVDAEGWIPVHVIEAGLVVGSGFYDALVDEFVDLPEATVAAGQWWYARDGEIEYMVEGGEGPELVVAGPEGERARVAVPEIAGLTPQVQSVAGPYRLLAGLSDDANIAPVMIRVDLDSGERISAEPELPAGLEPFDCYDARRYVDLDGHLLFEVRDEGAAYLRVWDPEAGSWDSLGRPLAGVDDLDLPARFGRVHVIEGFAEGTTFCPPVEWPGAPAEDALSGSTVQLVRAEPALELVTELASAGGLSVDADERCAAWPTPTGFLLTDLDDLDTLELSAGTRLIWLP